MNAILTRDPLTRELILFTISSFLIVGFLFYIDEGTFSFDWMSNWGGWIVFFIYMIPMLVGQLLISSFILRNVDTTLKTVFSILIGNIIGFLAVMFLLI